MAVLGLLALFQYSSLITLGGLFSRASLLQRRRHVLGAEGWPLIPFRELVRLIRSLTLLAFYDHPLTRTRLGFHPGGKRAIS